MRPSGHLFHSPVDRLDPVFGIQDHDPFLHAGEYRFQFSFLRVGHPDLFLEGRHHFVDAFRQLSYFIPGVDPQRSGDISRADLPGERRQSADGGEHLQGKQQGDRQGDTNDRQNHNESGFSHPIGGQGDFREGARETDVSRRPRPLPKGDGHVDHILLQGEAVANRLSHALQAGFLDLRAVEVIVHLPAARLRICRDPARGVDQRQAGAGALRQFPGMPRDLSRRHQSDDPRLSRYFVIDQGSEIRPEFPFDQETGDRDDRNADREKGEKEFMEKAKLHPFSADAGLCRTLFPVTM